MFNPSDLPPLTGARDPIAIHAWAQMASSLRQALLMLATDCPAAALADLKLACVRHSAGLDASGGAANGTITRAAYVAARLALHLGRGLPLTVGQVAELGQAAALLSDWSGELVGRHAAILYPPLADEAPTGAIHVVPAADVPA